MISQAPAGAVIPDSASGGVLLPAGSANLASLTAMRRDFSREDAHPFDAATSDRLLAELLGRQDWGLVLLVRDDAEAAREVQGYAVLTWGYSLEFGGRDALLDEFYIRPAARGRGLGSRALAELIDLARDHGARAVHLELMRANRCAGGLYRRQGFAPRDSVYHSLHLHPPAAHVEETSDED